MLVRLDLAVVAIRAVIARVAPAYAAAGRRGLVPPDPVGRVARVVEIPKAK
jgi:hypothetical protein